MSEKPILSIRDLLKTYPGVIAVNHVSFDVMPGEVHCLIGENGAGKSTLIKMLSGAIRPDSGSMIIEGKEFREMTPKLSKSLGIEVIYQEFMLVQSISVAENIYLGENTDRSAFVDMKAREKKAEELCQELGIDLNPSDTVGNLSPGKQQLVEICKAVSRNVKILIMDEPTAPLTVKEVGTLFRVIATLKKRGVTIIYISHRLEELFEVGDRITVMRDGKYITTTDVNSINRQGLIKLMAGRDLVEQYPARRSSVGEEILRVEHLYGNGDSDISFSLHKGEILGFAGLVGAGRTELMRVLYGANPIESGKIFIEGKEVHIHSCSEAIRQGIGYIPEDRKNQGVFLRLSIKANVVISNIRQFCNGVFVDSKKETEVTKEYIRNLSIKTPSMDQLVGNLSGGNQQKVVIAKTLAANSRIVIFDEPTRGIDVSAKQEIYALMNDLAEKGNALIMVSSDMPELLGMCDRIIVISEGAKTGELSRSEFDQNRILDLASITRQEA